MKILTFISILSIIFLLSCEKDANITLPEYNPKLVVHSFISPDDTIIKVHVSATLGIFGADTIYLENEEIYPEYLPAQVTLIDGLTEVQFSSRNSKGFCYAKYKIEAGKDYKLLVQCSGYPDASANCKVPPINDLSISLDTIVKVYNTSYGIYYEKKLLVNFTDLAGKNNFYSVYGVDRGLDYVNPMFMETQGDSDTDSEMIRYISDNLSNGKTISTVFSFNEPDSLEAFILETDEHYYNYYTSWARYKDSDQIFTEFSPVYTNLKNGFGIFASYVRHKRVFVVN